MKVTTKQRRIKYVAVGTKGTAGCFRDSLEVIDGEPIKLGVQMSDHTWTRMSKFGLTANDLGDAHGRGRAFSIPIYNWCPFVSQRKESFAVYLLKDAIRKGIVEKHQVVIRLSSGELKQVTIYPKATKNWSPSKQSQSLACDGIPALRIELADVNDQRNSGLTATIVQ